MPSFFLLLVMSLALASQEAKNQPRLVPVATNQAGADGKTEAAKIALPAAPSDAATPPPAMAIIEAAAQNLSVQSEIDAPIVVKFWASQKIELAPDDVAALVEQPVGAPLETQTVADFFQNSATIEDWMDADEKATARKFQEFIETLETQLENPRVYLFGERERTVIILGKVKGGFGGAVTLVVET